MSRLPTKSVFVCLALLVPGCAKLETAREAVKARVAALRGQPDAVPVVAAPDEPPAQTETTEVAADTAPPEHGAATAHAVVARAQPTENAVLASGSDPSQLALSSLPTSTAASNTAVADGVPADVAAADGAVADVADAAAEHPKHGSPLAGTMAIGPPTSGDGASCLAGSWTLDRFDWLAASVRRQAHGRAVRELGTGSGTITLTIDPHAGTLALDASHWRQTYRSKLAGVAIDYAVDVSGQWSAPMSIDGDERVQLQRPTKRSLRAAERVTFAGGSQTRRTVTLPLRGALDFDCDGDTLSLQPARGLKKPLFFSRAPAA